MINGWTKTDMYVADDRVNEYLAAGCTLAAKPVTEAEPVKVEPKPEPKKTEKKTEPKKTTVRKTTRRTKK